MQCSRSLYVQCVCGVSVNATMFGNSTSIQLSDLGSGHNNQYEPAPDHDTTDDNQPAKPRGRPSKVSLYGRLISDTWWLEFLSWLLATVLLVALFVLLNQFDNHPLSSWRSKLSLNTIIAIVTQVVQMVLLVPVASCLSQMQWLWYRDRHPLDDMPYFQDASTGLVSGLHPLYGRYASFSVWLAIIATLSQASLGAFAQQALSLPQRQILIEPNGTISRGLIYETPLGAEPRQPGVPADAQSAEVVPEMKLAI